MDSERFRAIRKIFETALEKDAASRSQFIKEACGGDEGLHEDVGCLLAAHISANSWIDSEKAESIIRPTSVTFKPGTKIGTYEILGLLGVGGMGEVYRARDTTLTSRQVALKVLPEAFARDPERIQRFEREALVLASLNHPHIGAIYHVIESELSRLLVLELVEGETLADRIAQGPLSVTETLAIAKQIADALESAHDKGIVHRDLKPANIKITPDDQVKVLDFGLAKARETEKFNPGTAPTLSETAPSQILGTAAYMSPEQASAKEADARSDVWAFGCLLYEMLTAQALFRGDSVSEILAEVLKGEPDLRLLPASTPQGIRRLLRRCLQKDRKRRLRHIADARLEIEDAFTEPESGLLSSASRMSRREALAWISVGGLAIATAAYGPWRRRARNDEITIEPHEGMLFTGPRTATVPIPQFAVSPDGKSVVFAAATSREPPMLWVRKIYETVAQQIPDTQGAESPFWSYDGTWIGFFSGQHLMKARADRSLATRISTEGISGISDPRGGSWSKDNSILFASGISIIYVVHADGGTVRAVTSLERGNPEKRDGSHRWPHFLPDGKNFLYTVRSGTKSRRGIWVGNVDDPKVNLHLNDADSNALYSRSGHLLYLEGSNLVSRPFNATNFVLSGQPASIAQNVGRSTLGSGAVSVSDNDVLAYAGPMTKQGRLTQFTRTGARMGQPLDAMDYEYTDFRLSHNERWLAATRVDHQKGWIDIWLRDMARSTWGQEPLMQPGNTINASPVWSADDRRIIFRSNPSGVIELYQREIPGERTEELVLSEQAMREDPGRHEFTSLALTDYAPDGSAILFSVPTTSGYDLWQLPMAANARPTSFLPNRAGSQIHGNFCPNPAARLVAYSSEGESNRYDVYLDDVPPGNHRRSVSVGVQEAEGGSEPRWSWDGRELYYLSEDRKLMGVAVEKGVPVGIPKVLFNTGAPAGINALRANYVPLRDGSFLVNTQSPDPIAPFITVLTNWIAGET